MAPPDDGRPIDLARINVLVELGRYADAASALSAVVGGDPTNAPALRLLSQALLQLDDPARALLAATSSLTADPDDEWGHRLAAQCLIRLGRGDEALDQLRAAARSAPLSWSAYASLARQLSRSRKTRPEAAALAVRAVDLAPLEPATHLAQAEVAAAGKRWDQAEAAFRRALALDPSNGVAHHELARLRLRRRWVSEIALAEAAEGFADAARIQPRQSVSGDNLRLVLYRFVNRVAYLLLLDAYVVNRALGGDGQLIVRLLPVLALAVPGSIGVRFLRRLSPPLRAELLRVVHGRFLGGAVLTGLAAVGIVAGCFAPPSIRPGVVWTAAGLALAGRVLVMDEAERRHRRASGARSPRHTPALVTVAIGGLFFAVLLGYFWAINPSWATGGAGLACLAGACGVAALTWRRREHRSAG